jgi:hypothetical protein
LRDRILGKTGIRVKNLGFGGIPIQRVSESEAVGVVRRCHELGVNYFDTARMYTDSEERIGKALRDVRDEVVIATRSVKRTREGLLEDLDVSLRTLGTDHIDVYQLHEVSSEGTWKQVSAPGGAIEGLYEAREMGKIEHLGITSHNPDLLTEILNDNIFEVIMIPFSYLATKAEERLLPQAHGKNVGVVAMKPLGGGALSYTKTALKYVLGNSNVDVAVPGMMSLAEAEANAAVASGDYALTDDELRQIEEDRTELGDQFCRACDYCQPCPQGIPISFVLRAETQFLKLTGWTPGMIKRMPETKAKVDSCIKCGECESRCPYHLPIRDLLPAKMQSLIRRYENEVNNSNEAWKNK